MTIREQDRRAQQRRASIDDLRIIKWADWCRLKGFSTDTGRRLRAMGQAPPIVQLSPRRLGVTVRADREWTEARIKDGV
jgi:hypothetical protein